MHKLHFEKMENLKMIERTHKNASKMINTMTVDRIQKLSKIWKNYYRKHNRGLSLHKQIKDFEEEARKVGYTQEEIDLFLSV